MSPAAHTFPVQALREQITALEAALTVCLAEPEHRPVHKLRTETRRVEALLLLLPMLPGLPEHHKQAAALRRALDRVRRPAGAVRDLDVHRKMLEQFAADEEAVASRPANPPADAANGLADQDLASPLTEAAPQTAALLSQSATELHQHMGHQREKAAVRLQKTLAGRQAKTTRASEALLDALKPARGLSLGAPALLQAAETIFRRNGLLREGRLASLKQKQLHTLRKDAKAARYLAETLPGDPAVAAAAATYEDLQNLGGQWHDALEIARAARAWLGKGHALTAVYRAERDRKLAAYRAALSEEASKGAGSRKRSPRRSQPRPRVAAGA